MSIYTRSVHLLCKTIHIFDKNSGFLLTNVAFLTQAYNTISAGSPDYMRTLIIDVSGVIETLEMCSVIALKVQ